MTLAGIGVLENFSSGNLQTLSFCNNSVKGVACAEKIEAGQLDLRAVGRMMNETCANLLSRPH